MIWEEKDYSPCDVGGHRLLQYKSVNPHTFSIYTLVRGTQQRSVVSRDCYLYSTVVSHIFFLVYFLGDASVIMPQHMWYPEAFM